MLVNSSIIKAQEWGGGGVSKLEDAEGHCEMRLPRHSLGIAHVNLQQLWLPAQGQASQNPGTAGVDEPQDTHPLLRSSRRGGSIFIFKDVAADWLPTHEWEALAGPAVLPKRKQNSKKFRVEHVGEEAR